MTRMPSVYSRGGGWEDPMRRRAFVGWLGFGFLGLGLEWVAGGADLVQHPFAATGKGMDWLRRWQVNILAEEKRRYCDRESGEELGWLVSPFLNGFHMGFRATGDVAWVDRMVDWVESCLRRAVVAPDGHLGWPKGDGGGGEARGYAADSLLGESMLLRPMVLLAGELLKSPGLRSRYGGKAEAWIAFAEKTFLKWESRGSWREVAGGGLWVVPGFGIETATGKWSAGYADRHTTGFSNPANKQNHISRWLLALWDVTKNEKYRVRAEGWFRLMRSRVRAAGDGKYRVWNYWDPAGPWDYRPDGSPKHWIGVHPNGGYYGIDVEGMADAYEHGVVFRKDDVDALIRTNRDFMWNQKVEAARFQRIDGGAVDPRWKNTPGVLWAALLPYDAVLRQVFEANHEPGSWGGLALTPWYLARTT